MIGVIEALVEGFEPFLHAPVGVVEPLSGGFLSFLQASEPLDDFPIRNSRRYVHGETRRWKEEQR